MDNPAATLPQFHFLKIVSKLSRCRFCHSPVVGGAGQRRFARHDGIYIRLRAPRDRMRFMRWFCFLILLHMFAR